MAQKLNGRRLKGTPVPEAFVRPEPALAEKASSEAHSLWVIYLRALAEPKMQYGERLSYVKLIST